MDMQTMVPFPGCRFCAVAGDADRLVFSLGTNLNKHMRKNMPACKCNLLPVLRYKAYSRISLPVLPSKRIR